MYLHLYLSRTDSSTGQQVNETPHSRPINQTCGLGTWRKLSTCLPLLIASFSISDSGMGYQPSSSCFQWSGIVCYRLSCPAGPLQPSRPLVSASEIEPKLLLDTVRFPLCYGSGTGFCRAVRSGESALDLSVSAHIRKEPDSTPFASAIFCRSQREEITKASVPC